MAETAAAVTALTEAVKLLTAAIEAASEQIADAIVPPGSIRHLAPEEIAASKIVWCADCGAVNDSCAPHAADQLAHAPDCPGRKEHWRFGYGPPPFTKRRHCIFVCNLCAGTGDTPRTIDHVHPCKYAPPTL